MGTFVSVRGWIECDDAQLPQAEHIIAGSDDGHYSRGWSVSQGPGWCRRIFYGADVRAHEVSWLLDQLRRIARLPASDADGDRVRGLFLASHEEDGLSEWQLRDGALHIAPGDARFRFLDA